MEMDKEFLDIFVLTAQENLLRYLQEFTYDNGPIDPEIEQLMLDIGESRDILLSLYVKKEPHEWSSMKLEHLTMN